MKTLNFIYLFWLLQTPVWAVKIIEDFNDNTFFDATSTGVWNGGLGQAHAPVEQGGNNVDLGTGADGACVFAGTITAGTYNCTSATLSNISFSGTNNVIIKVLGNVTVLGSVDLSGSNGNNGFQGSSSNPGATGRAGGGNGGAANNGAGANGTGDGPGVGGGDRSNTPGTGDLGGGGGGGGSCTAAATAGFAGTADVGEFIETPGNGGAAGNAGNAAAGLMTTLFAGSGGAGGGRGDNQFLTNYIGGSGGAGGGILYITSGGTITVNGAIYANGGNGGSSTIGGAGGGGSGGVIFLQGHLGVDINGTLSATQGLGGTATGFGSGAGGNGGNGEDGIIRLDKGNFAALNTPGTITPANSTNDTDYTNGGTYDVISKGYDTRGLQNTFNSYTVSEYIAAGDAIVYEFSDSPDNSTWSGWDSTITNLVGDRYIRFRARINNTNNNDTSKVYNMIINYDINVKSDYVFQSEITCATIGNNDPNSGTPPWNALVAFLFGILLFTLPFRKEKK